MSWQQLYETEPEPPSYAAPEFLTHKNYEVINVCCFKVLSFGVICYAAIYNPPAEPQGREGATFSKAQKLGNGDQTTLCNRGEVRT